MTDVKYLSGKIKKNISLATYSSFKIGGPARYFCVVENIDEIKEALKFAMDKNIKYFVLGAGSNLIFSDKGFEGLVMKLQVTSYKLQKNRELFVGAGLSLAKLLSESIANNLSGLEWVAGIPGTVGGAICNNSGAYGKSIADNLKEVEVLEIRKLEIRKLGNSECKFSYRDSIFKKEKKHVIISAVFSLEKGDQEESKKIVLERIKDRAAKQPLGYPSAGSIFKNPKVDDKYLEKIFIEYPELKEVVKNNTIPVWWFIDVLGLKGKKIGGVMISEKHGNFIINTGGGKAEDIVILISLIKQKVRDNFNIQLKEEIEYVGF